MKIQIYPYQYNYDKIVNTIGIQYLNLYTTDLFSMGKWQILCNLNTYSNFKQS